MGTFAAILPACGSIAAGHPGCMRLAAGRAQQKPRAGRCHTLAWADALATTPWTPHALLHHSWTDAMNARQAIAFVERHGIVLEAARGPVPSLAEAIAGGPIRGSWWGHEKGKVIFAASRVLADSPEVLVCKLVGGKVTYVHRRLWPALVKLASRFRKSQLARVRDEHTASGAHRTRAIAFPQWVPREVAKDAAALPEREAEQALAALLAPPPGKRRVRSG
jgi:hypothetical protein